jgi:hypothetical protein
VDEIGERLHELRESYAATLDDGTADRYRTEFTRLARKRFPRYVTLLETEP